MWCMSEWRVYHCPIPIPLFLFLHSQRGEKMSHEEVQLIIDEADENGDGRLDYAEFSRMILNLASECVQAIQKRVGEERERKGKEGRKEQEEEEEEEEEERLKEEGRRIHVDVVVFVVFTR